MKTIKGPAIFLAQFAGDAAPFNKLDAIARWAAGLGYKGVQIPTWDARLFDLAEGRREQDLLRRGQGHRWPSTACRSPSCRPTCRASSSRCIRPMTPPSTASRTGGARQPGRAPGMGGRAAAAGRAGLAATSA